MILMKKLEKKAIFLMSIAKLLGPVSRLETLGSTSWHYKIMLRGNFCLMLTHRIDSDKKKLKKIGTPE